MSSTIRIDASGSAPSFMDRVQAGMDKVIKSERNLDSALQRLSRSFQATSTNSEMLSNAAETLAHKFAKGAVFGSAAAVGMVLANSMKEVGGRILSVGQAAETALSGLNGVATSIGEASSRAQTLTQAAADTRKALEDLSQSNIVNAGIFKLFGGDQVLGDLEESLKGLASLEVLTATKGENKNLQRLLDASPEQRPDLEKQIKREQEMAAFKSSKAFQGADPKTREKMLLEFQKNQSLKESLDNKKENEKTEGELLQWRKKLEKDSSDYIQKLKEDAEDDERTRNSELARKREQFQYELQQARIAADKMTADRAKAEAENRGARGLRVSAATETLDIAAGMGDPQIAAAVERERKKQADEQAKRNRKSFDDAVLANTSEFNADGGMRSMASRRSEFIAQQAKTEGGGKSLTDVWTVLDQALSKIINTPMVGAN